jgi:hypothetical protein
VTTLIEFLTARLDEDEAVALAASQGNWEVDDPEYPRTIHADDYETEVVSGGRWGGESSVFDSGKDPLHIARHDPARVLREVAAKRAILADIVPAMNGADEQINSEWGIGPMDPADYESVELLRLLALPYSDHPDFDPNWSTT